MTRLSQILLAATLVAAPVTAMAQDADPPADPPADPVDPNAGATVAPTTDDGAMVPAWSKSVIDRPLTVLKGKLGVRADLLIAHASITILGTTASSTAEGLGVGAAYGISDKFEVGGSYSFTLNEFEIKGPLTLFGAFSLVHSAKLDIGASADVVIDLAPDTATETIHAGLAVRYKIAPKFAVFTGTPWAPGPLGQHLSIGLNDGARKSFSLPIGFGMQATPELFAYLSTNLLDITLSDVPDGADRVTSIADYTPLTLGGFFAINKNIDAAASLSFFDLQNAGDFWAISLGVRYYN